MPFIHYANREVVLKVVYSGPALSGKTTNLEKLHAMLPNKESRQLLIVPTANERTLFFDFLNVADMLEGNFKARCHVYTVPGQVIYKEARKVVLRGADGIVMVYDSQATAKMANKAALEELIGFLSEQGQDPNTLPIIIQYNKRDLPDILPIHTLEAELNPWKAPFVEAAAIEGKACSRHLTPSIRAQKSPSHDRAPTKKGSPPWFRD